MDTSLFINKSVLFLPDNIRHPLLYQTNTECTFLKHAVQDTRTSCCIPVLTDASQRSHWFLNDIRMSEVVRAHNIIQFHFQECLSHPSYTLPPNRRVPVVLNRAITWCNSWQSHSTTARPNVRYHTHTFAGQHCSWCVEGVTPSSKLGTRRSHFNTRLPPRSLFLHLTQLLAIHYHIHSNINKCI